MISHATGELLEESVKVALALVEGGNKVSQEFILNYLRDSIGEENFFGSIHKLIDKFIQELKQRQILEAGKTSAR